MKAHSKRITCVSLAVLALTACQTIPEPGDPDFDPAKIVLGNGDQNRIETDGLKRSGPTFIVTEVEAAHDSFLVLHPFRDGKPVRDDYVSASFVPAGTQNDVILTTETVPETDAAFIIMLHRDVDMDGLFDFGDGVTVPDAPVFEGYTMIASQITAPESDPVTPAIIRQSAAQNAQLAANYMERSEYRSDRVPQRIKAIAHKWMSIAEAPKAQSGKARDLFANEFQINFPSGPITTDQGLSDWLSGPASQPDATRHVLSDMRIETVAPDRYRLDMTVDWNGLMPDGGRMTAQTAHSWYLIDGEGRDHPVIETVDVTIVAPFAPTEWD